MKRKALTAVLILTALFAYGCAFGSSNPTTAPTATTAPTDTPTPVPTDTPTPVPTDTPTPVPTDTPTPVPTDTPTPVPTDTPTPLPTDTPTPTPTATNTPTPTATNTPSPTPTNSPTPTMPVVSATDGPELVVGEHTNYRYPMDEEDENIGLHVDFIYPVEAGYDNLASALIAANVKAAQDYATAHDEFLTLAEDPNVNFLTWFYMSEIDEERSDSAVVSYERKIEKYFGGTHPSTESYGYNFDTATGLQLGLTQMVCDYEGLYAAVIADITANTGYKDAFSDETWKTTILTLFNDEKINWVATDEGLEVWVNEGIIAPVSAGEIRAKIKVKDYPQYFVAKYLGNYDGSIKQKTYDHSAYGTSVYNNAIADLTKHIGEYSYADAQTLLNSKGVTFMGEDDKKAAESESNAYMRITDPEDNNGVYRVEYNCENVGDTQTIDLIRFPSDNIMYIGSTGNSMVDPWIYAQAGEYMAVDFDDSADITMLYFVTLKNYNK